jgi:hypothetical protein
MLVGGTVEGPNASCLSRYRRDAMADPQDPVVDDDLSPTAKEPAEGSRDPSQKGGPGVPSHLGPAGDPAEGKETPA